VDVFWSGTVEAEEAGWYRAAVVNSPVAGASHLIYLDPPYTQEVPLAFQLYPQPTLLLTMTAFPSKNDKERQFYRYN